MKNIILFLLTSLTCTAQKTYEEAVKFYEKDNFDKAIELFTSAIKNNDHVAEAYMYRGNCKSLKNIDGFMEDFIYSENLNPNN